METKKSLFNTYIKGSPNSFDANFEPFNHEKPLYQHIVLVNSKFQRIINLSAVFASEDGFFLKNDRIIANLPNVNYFNENETVRLKLNSCNRYYYIYKDNNLKYYLIYTKRGFEKLRQYIYEATTIAGSEIFDENIIGAMTIYYMSPFRNKIDDACITILLSKSPIPDNEAKNIEELSWAPDTLTFPNLKHLHRRGFTLSLIHDFFKQTGYPASDDKKINFNLLGDWNGYLERNGKKLGYDIINTDKAITKINYDNFLHSVFTEFEESQKLETYLRDNYDMFSDELKDTCAYLLPNEYKYTSVPKDLTYRFRDDKLIAFTNIMMFNYKTGATDKLIPLSYTEEDLKDIGKLADSLTTDLLRTNKLSWLDSDGLLAMEYITGLTVYLSDIETDKNFQLKSIFAVWAYYMLYKNMQECHEEDKYLLQTLIFHILGTNGKTFSKFMDRIKHKNITINSTFFGQKTSSWSKLDSDSCVGELIYYFSNSFNTFINLLSEEQKQYLGYGCSTHAYYLEIYRSFVFTSETKAFQNIDKQREEYAKMLYDYIYEILHRPDYTNKCILNVIMEDFNFEIDNIINYEIKDKYLPVRAMTADNMNYLGDVAIIGCNPIKYNNLGNITTEEFEISENNNTEYFVFSKYIPLYNDLVRKVKTMDSWIPNSNDYFTIKGWIHGSLRIIHIDRRLY